MSRYRNVCFTSYDEEPKFIESIMSYLIYGLETCPSTGREHWQGYVEFSKQISRAKLKEILGSAHVERRMGSSLEAATYCAKGESYCEHGRLSQPGTRTDLHTAAESIINGSSISSIAIASPALFVQYGRGLSLLSTISQSSRQRKWRNVRCSIWFGPTGLGKTRQWFDTYDLDNCYRFNYKKGEDFWCGYTGQKNILFDEFECQILLSNMLMYMDGHPLQLNIKFGHSYADWDTVTIISNTDPHTFYSNCTAARRDAFARRVNETIEFQSPETRIIRNSFAFDHSIEFVTADAL